MVPTANREENAERVHIMGESHVHCILIKVLLRARQNNLVSKKHKLIDLAKLAGQTSLSGAAEWIHHRTVAGAEHFGLWSVGLGIALDPNHLTVEALHAAVEQVYNTPSYRERVQPMQQTVGKAGGYQRATDLISDFAHRQKENHQC